MRRHKRYNFGPTLKDRDLRADAAGRLVPIICKNCGEPGLHWFPASMGEPGWWTCQPIAPAGAEGGEAP